MNQQAPENEFLSELNEEMFALKLRIAFAGIAEKELRELAAMPDPYSAADRLRAETAIRKKLRQRALAHFVKRTLPRVGRIAAALLLVCFIGLSTAIATVQSVRVRIVNFIMHIGNEYTELQMEGGEENYMEVPADWPGYYFPAYIPEGFALANIDLDFCEVYFDSADERMLLFSEKNEDTRINIDTESAQNRFIEIAGSSALVSSKNGKVFVAWFVDSRYFVIRFNGSEDEAIKIAESVRMIK